MPLLDVRSSSARSMANLMPAVHSRRVCLARFSSESYSRWGCASVTLYTLTVSSQSTLECRLKKKKLSKIRGNSQARHETLWLGRHRGSLKKQDLTRRDTSVEARHERQGYTRASEVSWVFPSTFSFSPCLGFSRWECTAGITHGLYCNCAVGYITVSTVHWLLHNLNIKKSNF